MAGGLDGAIAKRAFFGYVVAGLVISTLSGLHQWASGGFADYMKQGWFHGKLTLVMILLAVTGMLFVQVGKAQTGQSNRKLLMAIHGIAALCLVGIVFLTKVR